jgi:serpin B
MLTQANNQFAVDIYGQLNKQRPGKNLFFSPSSISAALAMTAAGARGQTAAEMAQTLHLAGSLPQANAEYRKLLEQWNSSDTNRGYQLRVANRLWGQKGFPFLDSYLALTRDDYGAELGLVDYAGQADAARQEINAWIQKQTAGRISDLLPQGSLNNATRLVLTNAIYFKGEWASQFKKDQTHNEDFVISPSHKVSTPLMHKKLSCSYLQDSSIQVLELPYKGNSLSMMVLLPRDSEGLADLEQSLSANKIAALRAQLRPKLVEVYLPKFKIDATFQLTKTLQELGMQLPFTKAADFSGMDGRRDLQISTVIHKAFVDVAEEGTEAAAATGVVLRVHSARVDKPLVFRADHPFVFAICDKLNGSILFLGRVADPKGN